MTTSPPAPLFAHSASTIYALSTPPGRAGIAVIRISGPLALPILASLCAAKQPPRPRHAAVRTLHDPESPRIILDASALVLYFPGPKSVTGEDVVELHVHGGTATVRAVLGAIPRCGSRGVGWGGGGYGGGERAQYAGPGEFTRRAFMSGRLDLTQVEALGDTLSAETEQQRRAAVNGAAGKRTALYESWREMLLLARGELEALIDFSEDQAFDESSSVLFTNTHEQIKPLLRAMELHELAGSRSELLRNGISVALLGPVNAGKSSLMNVIVGRDASIVSDEAGTTRDVVEARLDLGGFLCSFADTAGIRAQSRDRIGAVELEGIKRARAKAAEAAVVVVVASIESGGELNGGTPAAISFDQESLKLAEDAKASLVVVGKCDVVDRDTLATLLASLKSHIAANHPRLHVTPIPISCLRARMAAHSPVAAAAAACMPPYFPPTDPGGISAFTEALVARFAALTRMPDDNDPDLLGVTERQRQLLAECRHFLGEFSAEAERANSSEGRQPDVVLAAEYLRFAASCLARITGRGEAGDVNEVLGVVFDKFCVGK